MVANAAFARLLIGDIQLRAEEVDDLTGVIAGYEALYAKKTGLVAAEIVSAQPLTAELRPID